MLVCGYAGSGHVTRDDTIPEWRSYGPAIALHNAPAAVSSFLPTPKPCVVFIALQHAVGCVGKLPTVRGSKTRTILRVLAISKELGALSACGAA